MEKNAFIQTYCRWVSNYYADERLSLKEKSNFDCVFWKSGCTVYQVRPLQCRMFPFWSEIVQSKESWEMNAANCPGMNNGKLHSYNDINTYLEIQKNEPIIRRNL
jgi:Fe-S-cluster containining protein